MKILLILPKSSGYIGGVSPTGKAGMARLSLSTLAALTPPEHVVSYHDSRLSEPDYEGDWDLVGFTAMTSEINDAYRMADKFRQKGKKVVIGGYHASALPEEAAQHADFVIAGEAEGGLWPQALRELQTGGLSRKIYKNEAFVSMENKEVPRREILDREMYYTYATIQATRGCPFACKFCTVTKFFGYSYRKRTVEEIIAELKSLPGESWFFVDDNLVGDAKFAKKLFKAMIPLKITWSAQGAFTITKDPELMDLYKAAGGQFVFIGFESISPDTIKHMHKGSSNKPEKYEQGIRELHKRGISVVGSFVFGFDDDDISVFKQTVAFVNKVKIDAPMYNILTPFPGTKIFDEMKEQCRIHDFNWDHYELCHSVITPKKMTSEELQNGWAWATKETYKFSSALKRIIRSDPGWKSRVLVAYSYFNKARFRCPEPKHPEKYV